MLNEVPEENDDSEEQISYVHDDLDLIEASGAELLSLATRIQTPFFKSKVLKLSAEAYKMVNLGAAVFSNEPAYFDDEDED